MSDFYLKFVDEEQAQEVLYTKVVDEWSEDPEVEPVPVRWHYVPNYVNIDTIGVIYEEQEIVDPENPPEPIVKDGWHVNVRVVGSEDVTALEPYSILPENPRRVWG